MKTLEYTEQTGNIKAFFLQDEVELMKSLSNDKPSKRPILTKKGRKAIEALKDVEINHNHSWYQEIKNRASKDLDATALFYRGTKISFREMIETVDKLALSFDKLGVKKGDMVPCCLANTPELVYTLFALNKIGAKLNLFGANYNKEFIKTILDGCTDKVFIATDNYYDEIKDVVNNKNYTNKVLYSLADSLPLDPTKCDEYEKTLDEYYHYDNKVNDFKLEDSTIMSFQDVYSLANNYDKEIIDDNNLDTEFLCTYTSGSTNIGYPSQIIHTNRSLIVSGRFHDCELSGNPELKGLRGLSHIHADSNTNIITCISDNLMQRWSVALEPEYDKDKALDYLFINKPNYANMTTSFYIQVAKDYLLKKKFHEDGKGRKLPFLLAAFAVGEQTSKGEEKFINKFLRKARAGSGVKIGKFSMPFTTLSVGGGDCEHGGIYYTLWRSLMQKVNYLKLGGADFGMLPESFAQVTALKKDEAGNLVECNYNEYGMIVANSCTSMKRYNNNPEKTKKLIVRDNLGRDWVSSNVYGYIDPIGGVHVKSRVGQEIFFENGVSIPNFMIDDVVSMDTKNILSSTSVESKYNDRFYPIINIELQPEHQSSLEKTMKSVKSRCIKAFGEEIASKLYYRVMDNTNSFPLTGSGKRSAMLLCNLPIDNVRNLMTDMPLEYQEENVINKVR